MQGLTIPPGALPPEAEALRAEVRAFLAAEMPAIPPLKRCRNWSGADAEFSRKMGAARLDRHDLAEGAMAATSAARWSATWCSKRCCAPARRWVPTGWPSGRAARS